MMMGLSVQTGERKSPHNALFERKIIQQKTISYNDESSVIQKQKQLSTSSSTTKGSTYSAGEWKNNGDAIKNNDTYKVTYSSANATLNATPPIVNVTLDSSTSIYTINDIASIETITYKYDGKAADTYTVEYTQPQIRTIYRSNDTTTTTTTYSPQITETKHNKITSDEISAEICIKEGYYNGVFYSAGKEKLDSRITTKGTTTTFGIDTTYSNPAKDSLTDVTWTTIGTNNNTTYVAVKTVTNTEKVEVTDAEELNNCGINNTQDIVETKSGNVENSNKEAIDTDVTTNINTTYSSAIKTN